MTLEVLEDETSHSMRTKHVKMCKKVMAVVGTTFTVEWRSGGTSCVKGDASGKEQLPSNG